MLRLAEELRSQSYHPQTSSCTLVITMRSKFRKVKKNHTQVSLVSEAFVFFKRFYHLDLKMIYLRISRVVETV